MCEYVRIYTSNEYTPYPPHAVPAPREQRLTERASVGILSSTLQSLLVSTLGCLLCFAINILFWLNNSADIIYTMAAYGFMLGLCMLGHACGPQLAQRS